MRAHLRTARQWQDQALVKWLFGLAALTAAAGIVLILYYLAVRGRVWSSLSQEAIELSILAAAPALAAVLLDRRRQGNG